MNVLINVTVGAARQSEDEDWNVISLTVTKKLARDHDIAHLVPEKLTKPYYQITTCVVGDEDF